jgi:hypothetical protein
MMFLHPARAVLPIFLRALLLSGLLLSTACLHASQAQVKTGFD